MLVTKLYRLLDKKDGYFNKEGQKELIREDAIITQEYLDDVNDSSPYSGLYYEIDQEKTDLRDNYQAGEPNPKGTKVEPVEPTKEKPTE